MRVLASVDCTNMHSPRSCVSRKQRKGRHALLRFAEGRTGWSHWITLLCLCLVLLSGTIQAEHVHPASSGSPDTHAACSLCATAHVGVEAATAPLLQITSVVVGPAPIQLVSRAFLAPKNFNLYTRPPPTDPTRA